MIGRKARLDLIGQIVPAAEPQLHRMLSELQASEFIYEQPAFPQAEYVFKHALTQEVAYNSMLAERRELLHEYVATRMELLYAGRLEDHFEDLARHYSRSQNLAKAVEYLCLASEQSLARSQYNEAIAFAHNGLELINRLPRTHQNSRIELSLRLLVARASAVAVGYTSSEIEKALARAEEICNELEEPVEILPQVLATRFTFHFVRSDLREAADFATRLAELGREIANDRLVVIGEFFLGTSLFWQGHPEALAHYKTALSSLSVGCTEFLENASGVDVEVFLSCYLALSLWHQGYPSQASEFCEKAMKRATFLEHSFSLAMTHAFRMLFSWMKEWMKDRRVSKQDIEETLAISTELGFPYPWAYASFFEGLEALQTHSSDIPEGLASIFTRWNAAGTRIDLIWALTALVSSYAKSRRPEAGLRIISRAFNEMKATAQGLMAPELYRLQGELLLKQDRIDLTASEESYRTAIEVAQNQNGKSWELRVTMSLARLLRDTGRHDEAHSMLAEIYNWFTEGLDTPDLKDAKALLEELAT
jgi:tetratricopeptide (TPR) repeat protein